MRLQRRPAETLKGGLALAHSRIAHVQPNAGLVMGRRLQMLRFLMLIKEGYLESSHTG